MIIWLSKEPGICIADSREAGACIQEIANFYSGPYDNEGIYNGLSFDISELLFQRVKPKWHSAEKLNKYYGERNLLINVC